jgi:hypothetical protein
MNDDDPDISAEATQIKFKACARYETENKVSVEAPPTAASVLLVGGLNLLSSVDR